MKCNKKGLAIMVVLLSKKASVTDIIFHLEFQYQRLKCKRIFSCEKRNNNSNTTIFTLKISFSFYNKNTSLIQENIL